MYIMIKFHTRLRDARLAKGLKQADIAELLHVGRSTVSNWEVDKCPSYEILIKLARFFDISVDYLIGNIDDFGNLLSLESDSLK